MLLGWGLRSIQCIRELHVAGELLLSTAPLEYQRASAPLSVAAPCSTAVVALPRLCQHSVCALQGSVFGPGSGTPRAPA